MWEIRLFFFNFLTFSNFKFPQEIWKQQAKIPLLELLWSPPILLPTVSQIMTSYFQYIQTFNLRNMKRNILIRGYNYPYPNEGPVFPSLIFHFYAPYFYRFSWFLTIIDLNEHHSRVIQRELKLTKCRCFTQNDIIIFKSFIASFDKKSEMKVLSNLSLYSNFIKTTSFKYELLRWTYHKQPNVTYNDLIWLFYNNWIIIIRFFAGKFCHYFREIIHLNLYYILIFFLVK